MKAIFFFFLFFIPLFLWAQVVDTTAFGGPVDSLLEIAKSYKQQGQYNKAYEVIEEADSLTLEHEGEESITYADICHARASILMSMQDYTGAEKWAIACKTVREKVQGNQHPDYLKSLGSLAFLYKQAGQLDKAETVCLETIEKVEASLGKTHEQYASATNVLGNIYFQKGEYEKAKEYWLEAKDSWEKITGKNNINYVGTLVNLGNYYSATGIIQKGIDHYLEAKQIFENELKDIRHPYYLNCLGNLGRSYFQMAEYEKSEAVYLDIKHLFEKELKDFSHPIYFRCLRVLGKIYYDLGQYEKAETFFLKVKGVLDRKPGEKDLNYMGGMNGIAILYFRMGRYKEAEETYLEIRELTEKLVGKIHPYYPGNLINLAYLYTDMGQFEKAEKLFLEAKEIFEVGLNDTSHEFYALGLQNLGSLYIATGRLEEAETLHLRSKNIIENTLGKETVQYGMALIHLSQIKYARKEFEQANSLCEQAKIIFEHSTGKETIQYANTLEFAGLIAYESGVFEKAETLLLEAKNVLENSSGRHHASYVNILNELATVYLSDGQDEKAASLLEEAAKLEQAALSRALHHLSEQEMNQYVHKFERTQDRLFSFAQQSPLSSNFSSICFDNILFHKGFLLQSGHQIKRLALSDSVSNEQYNLLKSYHRLLAGEYAKPLSEQKEVEELERRANDLEKEMVRTVAGFGEFIQQVRWQEVRQSLQEGEAVIEFVAYRYYDPEPSDSTMYGALLLLPDGEPPRFVPLFEEKELESQLRVDGERKADYVNTLYTVGDRGAQALDGPRPSLYDLLWQPLEEHLMGVQSIYYSPAGLLHRLSLHAIPVNDRETLSDRFRLVALNSTRQLVIPTEIENTNNDAILFGGIEYELDTTRLSNTPLLADASKGTLDFDRVDSNLRGGSWGYLSGTEQEVRTLEKILQDAGMSVDLRTGYRATETFFKNLGAGNKVSPKVLHIATHGYFFPDPEGLSIEYGAMGQDREPVFKISDHPMLRSGLILAGGNTAWQGQQVLEGWEDGILTAYEISQMDLSNTELVVLSACETGLGDIKGNEGVYGLQRAFKIAGVKYLIMSLWQVPDKQTSLLMRKFYEKWMEEGMDIPAAFHAAQQEMREMGFDPYQWAGFVLVE